MVLFLEVDLLLDQCSLQSLKQDRLLLPVLLLDVLPDLIASQFWLGVLDIFESLVLD